MSTMRIGMCYDADVLTHPRYRTTLASFDVLLFPELMDGGYAEMQNSKPSHSFGDNYISFLKSASREFSCTLIAGSVMLREGTRRPTNTSLVYRSGKLIHRYDKIHLFQPTGDTTFFSRGRVEPEHFSLTFRLGNIRAGVVICYDVRFPELMRKMALEGMKILFVPARWPEIRDDAWQSLLKARAIENQIFVVGCNSLDSEGGFSYVFNPLGRMIFSNRKQFSKPLHAVQINLDDLKSATKLHRNLKEAVFLRTYFR